jgi:branched-chain amino acid transport system permease protein
MMTWRRIAAVVAPAALPVLLLCGLALAAKLVGTARIEHSMVEMLILLVVALGIYLFIGNSGILSFGHVSFMAIGAYATAWLTLPLPLKKLNMPGLPSFLHSMSLPVTSSAILSGTLAALVGLLIGVPLLRLTGIAASIATLALLVIVYIGYSNWDSVTLGTSSIVGLPSYTDLWTALAWAVIMIVIAYAYQTSRHGLMLRAARDDEPAAKAVGVNVFRERLIAWTLSAFIVGIGGVLYAHFLGTISTEAFYLNMTFITLAMLVVGGMGSISGAVVGVVAISLLIECLRRIEKGIEIGERAFSLPPGTQEIGIAVAMLAILLVRPRGISGGREMRLPARWFAASNRSLAIAPSNIKGEHT